MHDGGGRFGPCPDPISGSLKRIWDALAAPADKSSFVLTTGGIYMNDHHKRMARLILDRANDRTRNPKGREAKAEKAKISDMPTPDCLRPEADRRPVRVVSPQSSWGSITRGVVVTEYLGEGFAVASKRPKTPRVSKPKAPKNPKRADGPATSL